MIPLVLAALVAAGGELQGPTLAGVTLGGDLTQVLSQHPGAQRSASPGQRWVWSRHGGGMVTVTADDLGNITRVDFVANKGLNNNIDLPCVGVFPVQDSAVNLNFALGKTACGAFNGALYGLPDRSLVDVRFDGPGDGRLIEATWYRPSDQNPSPVGHMNAVIHYLRPAAQYGGAGRIYYAGECQAPGKDTSEFWQLLFPAVYLQPAATGSHRVNGGPADLPGRSKCRGHARSIWNASDYDRKRLDRNTANEDTNSNAESDRPIQRAVGDNPN